MKKKLQQKRQGFTLIELLVVISIIGLLASIILASLTQARQKSVSAGAQLFNDNVYHNFGDNMLAQWDFDDLTTIPATEIDSSGKLNTLSLLNGAFNGESLDTSTYSGIGNAVSFQSFTATAYGQATSLSVFPVPVTISTWIKITSATPHYVMYASDNFGDIIYISINSGKVFYSNGYTGTTLTSVASVGDGNWHHIALVVGATKTSLYVDGRADTSLTVNATQLALNNLGWYIGKGLGGSLDEFRIYNTILSYNQVQHLYAACKRLHGIAMVH